MLIFQSKGHRDDVYESFPQTNHFTSLHTLYGFILAVVYECSILHMALLKVKDKYHDYQKEIACRAHWYNVFIKGVHPAAMCTTWQAKPVYGSQFLYNYIMLFIEASQMSSAHKQNKSVTVDMKSSSGLDNLLKLAFGQNSFQLFW